MLEDGYGFQHDKLRVLKGGFIAWINAGYPIETITAIKATGKIPALWGKIKTK
jgi:3-mercaptopyruvate sulfurtransferase SseA